jgi:hypothetical protein
MTYSSTTISQNRAQFLGNKSGAWARGRNTMRFDMSAPKVGPFTSAIMLAVGVCLIGAIYVSQTTITNSLGYDISSLSQKRQRLAAENQSLQVESARLQSIDRIKTSPIVGSMVTPNNTEYATQ